MSRFPGRRARLSVLLTLALFVLAMIPLVDQLVFRYVWANSALEEVGARHARLLGLRDAATQINHALDASSAMLELHAYPADSGADRVGADLQQRVRRLAESASVAISGSQILPPRPVGNFQAVPLNIMADGDIGAVRDFLASVGAESPSIQVDSLNISVPRQRGRNVVSDGKVRAQIQLSAIHLLP